MMIDPNEKHQHIRAIHKDTFLKWVARHIQSLPNKYWMAQLLSYVKESHPNVYQRIHSVLTALGDDLKPLQAQQVELYPALLSMLTKDFVNARLQPV